MEEFKIIGGLIEKLREKNDIQNLKLFLKKKAKLAHLN
jgi:hypothetical protein